MAHRLPVSDDESHDPLKKMRAYQMAVELIPDAYNDALRIYDHPITKNIAPQLYDAVSSIEANISEAYSRSSGKDRAARFEYALGSVRESMSWYRSATPSLDAEIVKNRRDRLEEIRRMLLAIIPRERGRSMK